MLGAMLLSEINLAYYQDLMQGIRSAIAEGRFRGLSETQTRAEWAARRHCAALTFQFFGGRPTA